MPSTGYPLQEFFWQRPLPQNAGPLAPSPQAEDWRHLVIEFQSRRIDTIFEFRQALDLSPTELDIGFALWLLCDGGGNLFHGEVDYQGKKVLQPSG